MRKPAHTKPLARKKEKKKRKQKQDKQEKHRGARSKSVHKRENGIKSGQTGLPRLVAPAPNTYIYIYLVYDCDAHTKIYQVPGI